MSRKKKPSKWQRAVDDRPLLGGWQARERRADGEWIVRRVTGSAAGKAYRCPGCDQPIPPATPHVVAWPENPSQLNVLGGSQSLDERRHWHTACWQRRP